MSYPFRCLVNPSLWNMLNDCEIWNNQNSLFRTLFSNFSKSLNMNKILKFYIWLKRHSHLDSYLFSKKIRNKVKPLRKLESRINKRLKSSQMTAKFFALYHYLLYLQFKYFSRFILQIFPTSAQKFYFICNYFQISFYLMY